MSVIVNVSREMLSDHLINRKPPKMPPHFVIRYLGMPVLTSDKCSSDCTWNSMSCLMLQAWARSHCQRMAAVPKLLMPSLSTLCSRLRSVWARRCFGNFPCSLAYLLRR